jgi:hypothetical protein
VDPIADVIPPSGDVHAVALTGNLATTGSQPCVDLMSAPPSGVVATSLGVLPESVFVEQKSILIVLNGCVGGAGHSDSGEALICGPGYASDAPTATLVAGFVSRIANLSRVSLQFAQASFGLSESTVRFRPAISNASPHLVDMAWGWGAIAPFPPLMAYDVTQLFGSSDANDIADGNSVALIGVGAAPPLAAGAWWNAFTFTAVTADP